VTNHTAKKTLELSAEDEDWIRNKPKSHRERMRERLEERRKKKKKKASPIRVASRYLSRGVSLVPPQYGNPG
jgi:hypothetical protein